MSENADYFTMKNLPEDERPYEKCEMMGARSLSDAELLSIIINSGTKGMRAIDVAYRLLDIEGNGSGLEGMLRQDAESFRKISGIGRIKAIKLEAVCELARRLSKIRYRKGTVMDSSDKVADYYMSSMRELHQEELHVMMLDSSNALIREECLTVGSINAALIDIRGIFLTALKNNAVYIILVHNHPSGNITPSQCDIDATLRIRESGYMLGIELIDHVIIGNMDYISLRKSGYI